MQTVAPSPSHPNLTPDFNFDPEWTWVNTFLAINGGIGTIRRVEPDPNILAQIPVQVQGMYGISCVLAEETDRLMVDMFNLNNPRETLSDLTVGYFDTDKGGVYAVNGGAGYAPAYIIEEIAGDGDRLTVTFAAYPFGPDKGFGGYGEDEEGRPYPWRIAYRFEVTVQDLGSDRIRLISTEAQFTWVDPEWVIDSNA
jgi:hypothetical protein